MMSLLDMGAEIATLRQRSTHFRLPRMLDDVGRRAQGCLVADSSNPQHHKQPLCLISWIIFDQSRFGLRDLGVAEPDVVPHQLLHITNDQGIYHGLVTESKPERDLIRFRGGWCLEGKPLYITLSFADGNG
jgi:hypothetical protein